MADKAPSTQILLYQTEDRRTRIEVRLENETVWLNQLQMAELFQTTVPNVSMHIRNVFREGELDRKSVVKEFLTTAADGKSYRTQFYNLDVIISVGYRVKSHRGTQFRIWATQRLHEYIIKGFTLDDVADFTPQVKALGVAELKRYRLGPLFNPPSLRGTVESPGIIGGAGWGGAAFDPETQTLYVKATNSPYLARLIQPPKSDTINARYTFDRTASLGISTPSDLTDGDATSHEARPLPINKPPYGTLVAIDMNTGERRWQVTVGDTPWIHRHPLLKGLTLGPLGVAGSPGPIVTAGGLVFVTGGGSVLYALDSSSGKILWQADLGQDGYAVPMTYATTARRQYVVIATGEGDHAILKAFALPEEGP